jgi:hypothetical protein
VVLCWLHRDVEGGVDEEKDFQFDFAFDYCEHVFTGIADGVDCLTGLVCDFLECFKVRTYLNQIPFLNNIHTLQ